jgi:hypothetical protein
MVAFLGWELRSGSQPLLLFQARLSGGGAELVLAISDEEHAAATDSLQALLVLAWKREGASGNLHSAFLGESVFLEAAVGFFGDGSFEKGEV